MTDNLNISFEFFPPKDDQQEAVLVNSIEKLAPLNPNFVSVTYGADGSTRERTHNWVTKIQRDTDLTPAAHLTCVETCCDEIKAIAQSYWDAGVRHLVALRGDACAEKDRFSSHPDGFRYASQLVACLRDVADFEISVAAYPEVHPEAKNADADLDNLKRKLDAGANRAITQFFFEAETFLRFRDRCVKAGIDTDLVPGILPVSNFSRTVRFAEMCGANIPKWLMQRFAGLDQDPATRQLIAASTAIDQVTTLREHGVTDFHFYTLNRFQLTLAICHTLGIKPQAEPLAIAV